MEESAARLANQDNPITFDIETFGLAQNYSFLISKLEKLAFAHDHSDYNKHREDEEPQRSMSDAEYARFMSDIWIGVVLTLLILSIIFFICSCFLYHKFQQWKNTYRTNSPNQAEIIRRYDLDVESLPSYTIVSGLPSYDDALDQFRKAGIIIQQPSLIKIFEDVQIKSLETTENEDNISVHSCTCGGGVGLSQTGGITTTTTVAPVIELNPEQLKMLSQKRLSLQIALNSSVRQSCNRSRVDLCREVNRSNLLRSHDIPQIHRSTSSLYTDRNFVQRIAQLHQHRGSIA